MIEADAVRFIRLGVIVLTGGLSSAASIGALVHTHQAKQQAFQESSAGVSYEHHAGNPLPIVALGTRLKVYQTNGSVVEGTVKATHAQWLKLAAPELGAITVSQEKIARIEGLGTVQHQPLQFNDQRLKAGTTPAPRQRAQPTSMKQYPHTEQEAQRALEAALRNNDGQRAEEMRAIIKQFRQAQAAINQQQKAHETHLAQQQKEQEEREGESNKWKTSFDDKSPSQVEETQRAVEQGMEAAFAGRTGERVVFKRVRSSSSASSSASNVGGTTIYVPQGYSEHIEVQNAKVVEVPDGHKVVYRPDGTQTFEPATECDKALSNYESTGYLPSNCR